MIANRQYIKNAISAILEDMYGHPMNPPYREEFISFFEPEAFEQFKELIQEEFDLSDNTIVESTSCFGELIAILESELFF